MTITGPSIQSMVAQLQTTASQATPQAKRPAGAEASKEGENFASALRSSIDQIDALKHEATATGHAFERGEPGIGVNDVMVNMEKAGLAFEMGVQVRNRVVSAYKDIMNMQV